MSSRPPTTPAEARHTTQKAYCRHAATWAAGAAASPASAGPDATLLSIALHPPTQAQALQDVDAARDWTRTWQSLPLPAGAIVEWETRRWSAVGAQRVPVRLLFGTAEALAGFCGQLPAYRSLVQRLTAVGEVVVDGPLGHDDDAGREQLAAVLRSSAQALMGLAEEDVARLRQVLGWLRTNPESHMFIRQAPIRGVDTKWLKSHLGLVKRLHAAGSGRHDLGLRERPPLTHLRVCDSSLAPGGMTYFAAPIDALAAWDIEPACVVVMENLETLLSLPEMDGVVVVHGSGYAVNELDRIPWMRRSRILYWGDVDTHGFAILHRLRSQGLEAESVLMDVATLDHFSDLCVPEPTPHRGRLELLTAAEQTAFDELRRRSDIRLEQERIDWGFAVDALQRAILTDGP